MYAYGSSDNFYPNLRFKTEPWRGMTAGFRGKAYLIIDKDGDDFVLENEEGEIIRGQHFDWTPTTPANRIVAASRAEDSIFKRGNIINGYRIGQLRYNGSTWLVTVDGTDTVFPLDTFIEELDEVKWNKQAYEKKFAADPAEKDSKPLVCPKCGSHTLRMLGVEDNKNGEIVCLTCGNQFTQPIMRNPEAKTALTYPEDPNAQAQMIGLMQQLAQANEMGNREEVKRIQAEIEKLMGGYDADTMVAPGAPFSAPAGGSPFGGRLYSSRDAAQKEHLKGVDSDKRQRQYEHILASCKKEHPDWSLDECKELAARTVNKQRAEKGETKNSALSGELIRRIKLDPRLLLDSRFAHLRDHPYLRDEWERVKGELTQRSAAEKYQPGTRVQVTHPKHKGQRGTITEFKGKQEDIDEEKYAILLDSGDTLEELNESFFSKIKSANVNQNLPDTTQESFLESMSVTAGPYDVYDDSYLSAPEDPYAEDSLFDPEAGESQYEIAECPVCSGPGLLLGELGSRVHYRCRNCGMDFSEHVEDVPLPELDVEPIGPSELPPPEFGPGAGPMGAPDVAAMPRTDRPFMGASKEADDFGGKMPSRNLDEREKHFEVNDAEFRADGDPDYPWDEPEEQKVACPNCKSNAKSLGVRGPVEQFACTNAECRMQFAWPSEPPAEHIENDPEALFGDFEGKTAYTDVKGESLKPGSWYSLHHGDYPVPDVVRILNIEDSHVEAAIASDEDNTFPIQIKAEDGYTFELFDEPERTEVVSKSGWKLARRNFSSKEQRDLVDENLEGKARNFDKLDLTGTHYEIKYDIVDDDDELTTFFI